MTARPSRTRSVESSGTGRLLVAPADPRIEASCRYARGADARELIEHTEQQMLDDSVWLLPADYQMGVDFGLAEAPSYSLVHVWTADTADVPLSPGDVLTIKTTITISE